MSLLEVHHYYSHILGRKLNVEVTGTSGYPIIMFPTSKGSVSQNRDFGLLDTISQYIDDGKVKIYNIETLDAENLYNENIAPHERIWRFEQYIQFMIQEFVPFIKRLHNTERVAVAGCSFGGFHAANFAFRFPGAVSHMFCLSGAFSCRSLLDGYHDDLVYFNCPEEFVVNDESWKYNHMNIVLSTSDEDICLNKTQRMAGILSKKGINHWYDEQKWIAHDWPLWKMMFPRFVGTYFS